MECLDAMGPNLLEVFVEKGIGVIAYLVIVLCDSGLITKVPNRFDSRWETTLR